MKKCLFISLFIACVQILHAREEGVSSFKNSIHFEKQLQVESSKLYYLLENNLLTENDASELTVIARDYINFLPFNIRIKYLTDYIHALEEKKVEGATLNFFRSQLKVVNSIKEENSWDISESFILR